MNNPPGRPIVSGSGGPTEKISQFVDHFIWSSGATIKVIHQGFHPYDQYPTTP